MKKINLLAALFFFSITLPHVFAQTVKTFAGKAYFGSGSFNGTRLNHIDSVFFSAPEGIDIDTAGKIYISNEQNIMLISGTNCKLVAGYQLDPHAPGASDSKDGTGIAARFSNPSGICIYPPSNELYVADVDNHQARKVSAFVNNFTDPQVTTIAGVKLLNGGYLDSTNATSKFNSPYGIAMAANGDIYIADRNNHCIRKISGGNVTTIGGKKGVQGHTNGGLGTSTFYTPLGLCLDGNFLYVADYGNSAIRKIDLTDNTVTDYITSGINAPTDLCKAGNIFYITQQTCVKKYENSVLSLYAGSTAQTGNVDSNGSAARFEYLTGIAYNEKEKNLYVVDKGNNVIKTIRPNIGPVCNFIASNTSPTKGQTVILQNTSTKKPYKFKWTISPTNYTLLNNSILTDSLIYLNFLQTGPYTVKLWVANDGGADSLTKNSYINVSSVIAAPTPDFHATKTNPAANEVISLIDQSANEPTAWKWRVTPLTFIYVNGTDSTSRIPNIKFTNGDNYTVMLIVSNAQGSATLKKTNYINVNGSSIHPIAFSETLMIYPNPCVDFVNIRHPFNGTVRLFNCEGKLAGEWYKNEDILNINVRELNSGLYYITLQTNEGVIRKKLIVGHK